MEAIQLSLFEIPAQNRTLSPFRAMSKVSIDEIFCLIGKVLTSLISMIGLIAILTASIEASRKEERIEELIYRRKEDEELLKEGTPDWGWFDRISVSKDQRRMIILDQIKRKMQRNKAWRSGIEKELATMQ